jgi:DNA repair protein RadC
MSTSSLSLSELKTRVGDGMKVPQLLHCSSMYGFAATNLIFSQTFQILEMQNQRSEMAVAHLKVSYKPAKQRIKIMNTTQAYKIFASVWDKSLLHIQEQFYVLFLNSANEVLCWRCFGTGTADKCLVDAKLIAATAVTSLAQRVVVAHNHPSGLLRPSDADKQLTFKIQALLRLLDIQLLDHLIVGEDDFVSMSEHTMIFFDQEPFSASA